MSKDFTALKSRYLSDPHDVQIGGLASNLSRLGWFMKRAAAFDKLQPIIRESKYFTEWAAVNGSPDLQSVLAEIQLELAMLDRQLSRGKITDGSSEKAEAWSVNLLHLAGLQS